MTKKILLPSDGSSASIHAANYVAANLEGLDAHVTLLNVQPLYVDAEAVHLGPGLVGLHRAIGEATLRESSAILAEAGIEHDARVAFGPVVDVIDRVARRDGADAIVMGTRARNALVEMFAASVPRRVLRRAEVPVVLVRHDRGRDATHRHFASPALAA